MCLLFAVLFCLIYSCGFIVSTWVMLSNFSKILYKPKKALWSCRHESGNLYVTSSTPDFMQPCCVGCTSGDSLCDRLPSLRFPKWRHVGTRPMPVKPPLFLCECVNVSLSISVYPRADDLPLPWESHLIGPVFFVTVRTNLQWSHWINL